MSDLYNKSHWKKGTIRENIEAELLEGDAWQEKEKARAVLDEIEKRYKEAVRKELLNVKNP